MFLHIHSVIDDAWGTVRWGWKSFSCLAVGACFPTGHLSSPSLVWASPGICFYGVKCCGSYGQLIYRDDLWHRTNVGTACKACTFLS